MNGSFEGSKGGGSGKGFDAYKEMSNEDRRKNFSNEEKEKFAKQAVS